MNVMDTTISGLKVVEPKVFGDERGWFLEMHNAAKFAELGLEPGVVQINHSQSKQGVLRGLHFQAPPHDQTKLVRCVVGRLWDVAVDIRRGSPTYGQWYGVELSAANRKMLFVPSGFAHGFYALTDCEMIYLCGRSGYDKASEGGLRYDCPALDIVWPYAVQAQLPSNPLVIERDAAFPGLADLVSPFVFAGDVPKEET